MSSWFRSVFSRGGDKGEEPRSPAPFIVGVGRSGTTLLRLMLDAHPELAIPPETHFIPQAARLATQAEDPKRSFLDFIASHRTWPDYGIEESLFRERVAAIEPFDVGEALRVFYTMYAEKFDKSRWGDKTPLYVRKMSAIQEILPEARFIHVIRDGRDVAVSNKDLWFGPDTVEEAAERWKAWITEAREQSKNLDHYMEVRYEQLIVNTEATLKRVCDFLAVEWSDAMLDYHSTAESRIGEIDRDISAPGGGEDIVRGEDRTGIHALTSKPPQRNRIGRWKREMNAEEINAFEKVAGDILLDSGYRLNAESSLLFSRREDMKLQPKAEKLSEEVFVGSPPEYFESVGRLQLISLLREGLYPESKVLDIGCGCLRGGYWLIHFLDAGCYFGIEPNEKMLDAGIRHILEPNLVEQKRPSFDHNVDFDFSVFGENFDFILARSVWTHASKSQIQAMLDSFVRNSSENAVFLASYLPAGDKNPDYKGDQWLGRSHESENPGTIHHDFAWIKDECEKRNLEAVEILDKEYIANRQIWVKVDRARSSVDSAG